MADISKIKTPDGTTYNIKDETARSNSGVTGVKGSAESSYRTGNVNLTASNVGAVTAGLPLLTTNPFMPYDHGSRSLYISKIDNAFYAANMRFDVSLVNNGASSSPANLFDGDYEGGVDVGADKTATITFDFSESSGGKFPGYPYGYIYVSFYYVCAPKTITGRVYNTYTSQGEGWHDLTFTRVLSSAQGENVYAARQAYYGLQTLEITVTGDGSNTYGYTRITQIEMWLDRPAPQRTPFVSKYSPETLYYELTAPKFIGNLDGTATNVTGTVAIANGGTSSTTAVGAAANILSGLPDWSADPTDTTKLIRRDTGGTASFGQVTFSTVWNYIKSKIESLVLSTSTSSTSTTTAATSSAVKTAYDLADQANDKANTALSGVSGTLIYDHTYSISGGVATFTAHVYCKGQEVTSTYADSCFTWSYRLDSAISGTPSVVSLGTGKTKTITISTLGYGGHVIGSFTPPA